MYKVIEASTNTDMTQAGRLNDIDRKPNSLIYTWVVEKTESRFNKKAPKFSHNWKNEDLVLQHI